MYKTKTSAINRLRAGLAAKLGRDGEDIAASYLYDKGWSILERNWRKGRLELDIVCEDGEDLVFVEVRTRKANSMVEPAASVTLPKQRNIIKAARSYLAEKKYWNRPCRFDVICIQAGSSLHVEHIRHAFEYSQPLARWNTSW